MVVICKDKDDKLIALISIDTTSTQIKTIFNKFISRYNVKRKDIKYVTYNELVKLVMWPVEIDMDDWLIETQEKLSSDFINNEKQQLNG
jgi:hypothetical protein